MNINDALQKLKENKILEKIHLLMAIIILLWMNVGIFSYISNYIPSFLKIALFILWIFFAVILDRKFTKDLIKIILPIGIFASIMTISMFFNDNDNVNIYFRNFEYVMIITSVLLYYIKGKKEYRNVILYVLAIDIIYVGLNTFIKLDENGSISRILSTSIDFKTQVLGNKQYYAVGSFSYMYSIVMILLTILHTTLETNPKKSYIKKIYILLLIFFSILLIKAKFTISILLYIIFFLKIILEKFIKNKKNIYIVLMIVLLLIILILPIVTKFEIIPEQIRVRLIEINNILQGNDIGSTDVKLRLSLYTKSIDSFLNNIFIGSFGEDTVRRTL